MFENRHEPLFSRIRKKVTFAENGSLLQKVGHFCRKCRSLLQKMRHEPLFSRIREKLHAKAVPPLINPLCKISNEVMFENRHQLRFSQTR